MAYDPLAFGLSAGGNTSFGSGSQPSWLGMYGPGGAGRKPSGVSTTPTGAGSAATSFDIGQEKQLGQISDIINSINRSAQQSALQQRIPNAPALEKQSSALIGSELSGQVPADVLRNLQQQAAERGVATGVGTDSPNANAAYLRALGLTSLGLQQTGEQNLTGAEARNPAAPIFDPSRLLMTPEQLAATNLNYMSEADRVALEQQQLALEAARMGGGGRGGYGYPGTSTGTTSPYQYAEPGIGPVGTYQGPAGTVTGSSVFPYSEPSTADWLSSIGYNPNYTTPADAEAGASTTAGTDYASLFPGSVDYSSGE